LVARICIDLDGVIAALKRGQDSYASVLPVPGAAEKVRALKQAGHTIIIYTARHMKTCSGNVGQVVARVGAVTMEWLARHDIPFDEIYFGKPQADVYIDDNALRFTEWGVIAADGTNLPASAESRNQAETR